MMDGPSEAWAYGVIEYLQGIWPGALEAGSYALAVIRVHTGESRKERDNDHILTRTGRFRLEPSFGQEMSRMVFWGAGRRCDTNSGSRAQSCGQGRLRVSIFALASEVCDQIQDPHLRYWVGLRSGKLQENRGHEIVPPFPNYLILPRGVASVPDTKISLVKSMVCDDEPAHGCRFIRL